MFFACLALAETRIAPALQRPVFWLVQILFAAFLGAAAVWAPTWAAVTDMLRTGSWMTEFKFEAAAWVVLVWNTVFAVFVISASLRTSKPGNWARICVFGGHVALFLVLVVSIVVTSKIALPAIVPAAVYVWLTSDIISKNIVAPKVGEEQVL